MGGILSCIEGDRLPDVTIDLESASPNGEDERRIVQKFNEKVINPSKDLISRLQAYQDKQTLISQALSKPSPATNQAAADAVYPNILLIRECYDYCQAARDTLCEVTDYAVSIAKRSNAEALCQYHALIKCFAQYYNIMLLFDEVKMGLPKLLGDLSFFRRSAGTGIIPAGAKNEQVRELFEYSQMMTLFFGEASPMLAKTASDIQQKYSHGDDFATVLTVLSYICDVSTSILRNHPDANKDNNLLWLKCLVGSVLVCDQNASEGVFSSKSPMRILDGMQTLNSFEPKQITLVNAIKYSSRHYGDQTTIPAIRALFP